MTENQFYFVKHIISWTVSQIAYFRLTEIQMNDNESGCNSNGLIKINKSQNKRQIS